MYEQNSTDLKIQVRKLICWHFYSETSQSQSFLVESLNRKSLGGEVGIQNLKMYRKHNLIPMQFSPHKKLLSSKIKSHENNPPWMRISLSALQVLQVTRAFSLQQQTIRKPVNNFDDEENFDDKE